MLWSWKSEPLEHKYQGTVLLLVYCDLYLFLLILTWSLLYQILEPLCPACFWLTWYMNCHVFICLVCLCLFQRRLFLGDKTIAMLSWGRLSCSPDWLWIPYVTENDLASCLHLLSAMCFLQWQGLNPITKKTSNKTWINQDLYGMRRELWEGWEVGNI